MSARQMIVGDNGRPIIPGEITDADRAWAKEKTTELEEPMTDETAAAPTTVTVSVTNNVNDPDEDAELTDQDSGVVEETEDPEPEKEKD